ncbi:MAG: alpha/beta fold hydrolase [Betaproteobacteria bacterium]|nr:alpha/beta fold hydrolase [Betaproteobacteria bacterium]
MANPQAYKKPWWLAGKHIETIAARRLGPRPDYSRQIATTADDDPIAFDSLPGAAGAPGLCIFHGLEGCSQSHTVRQIASYFNSLGWAIVIPHFRSCGVMNKLPRAYHAGDSQDIGWMLRYAVATMEQSSGHFAVGVSLGGNALVKWLAENADQTLIKAAVAVAAPLDLTVCAARLDQWFNRRLYGNYFLASLKKKLHAKIQRYPFLAKPRDIERLATVRAFDEIYTAPIHGFASAKDYYRQSSALPLMSQISTPLLCLHADNDALVPVPDIPTGGATQLECTRGGGHAGYVTGPFPGRGSWLPQRLKSFYEG